MSEGRSKPRVTSVSELQNDAILSEVFSHYLGRKVTLDRKDTQEFKGLNDFFQSEMIKTHLDLRDGDGSVLSFDIIIKAPLPGSGRKQAAKFIKSFTIENFWYSTVVKVFPELSELSPICYYGHTNYDSSLLDPSLTDTNFCCFCLCFTCKKHENGILVLQDLSKGPEPYAVYDKTKILTFEHARVAFIALAKFHGSWFAFLNGHKESNSDINFTPAEIKKTFFMDRFFMAHFLAKLIMGKTKALTQLMKNQGEEDQLIEKVEKYFKRDFMAKFKSMIKTPEKHTKLITLIHGDFWSNNMMFTPISPDSHGAYPDLKVKILDYQGLCVGPIFYDINYFLYAGTDFEFRTKYLKDLMKIYFDILSEYLLPTLKITFEEFFEEVKKTKFLGLCGVLGVMPNALSPVKVEVKTFGDLGKIEEKCRAEISSPDNPDDHPAIREIRRRVLDFIHEFQQSGDFD